MGWMIISHSLPTNNMNTEHYKGCLAGETGLTSPVMCYGDAKYIHKQYLKQVHPDKRGGSHEKFIKA